MNLLRSVGLAIKAGLLGLLLMVCLSSEYLHRATLLWPFLNRIQGEVFATFQAADVQWLIVICISVYFVGFIWLLRALKPVRHSWRDASLVLSLAFYAIGALAYALRYDQASKSTDTLLLCFGITLVFGFRFWRAVEAKRNKPFNLAVVVSAFTLVLLSIAAVWHPESAQGFQYRGQARGSGPWGNPNTFGMLMGVGFVLATGLVVSGIGKSAVQGPRSTIGKMWQGLKPMLFAVAALLCGVGLIKSYSRGAWVGATVALAYLGWEFMRYQVSGVRCQAGKSADRTAHSIRKRHFALIAVILVGLFVLAFWSFRHTERITARRALSVANVNDFSWRNRMAAWEGGLQMVANRPLLGFGWNQPERVYEHFYRVPKVNESAAVQMNDYFTLGTTLGIPALVCFLVYVGLSLARSSERKTGTSPRPSPQCGEGEARESVERTSILHCSSSIHPDGLRTACRAGAIVLLIGFWFDGGLFKLATGAVFWILLELAREA
jgi:hypothetical protein